MICALIMAGGIGTRFWPISTEKKPKQFLNLVDDKTMLQLTYERMLKIIPQERIFILTGDKYIDLVKEQIEGISDRNIIIQPAIKNTAPCILLSTLYINQLYKDANIAVLPSDHMIGDNAEFCNTILKANNYLNEENKNSIITIGITPDRPESGYGYIKYEKADAGKPVIKVEKFVEKPTVEVAKTYLESGNYLWNAGIFIFNINYMLKEFEEKYSNTYKLFLDLPKIGDKDFNEKTKEIYCQAEEISVDYAIMEKSDAIYVIPGDFGWDDIGTWLALQRYIKPDENNNYIRGKVRAINSKNNIIYTSNKEIVLLDLEDVFCIDSDDLIVIGKREKLGELHKLRNK